MILGFSQGASIAASLLIHHQIDHLNGATPLFRAAIFICSPLPFSRCLSQGYNIRRYFGLQGNAKAVEGRPVKIPGYLIPEDDEYFEYFLKPEIESPPESDSSAGEEEEKAEDEGDKRGFCGRLHKSCQRLKSGETLYYQMLHASVDDVRIAIPTAHIYGRTDPWRLHSRDLVGLCDEAKVWIYQHDAGHEIPRDESEEICDVIESVLSARI